MAIDVEGSRPLSILYAEDDPVSGRVLGRTLQLLGYSATGFNNGQLALDWFIEHHPPIIVSDWMMPELDGLSFCQKVRELNLPHYTYFMMVTANTGEANYHRAMEHGVDDFLSKPFRREDLFIRLRVAERIVRQRWAAESKIRSLARFPAENPNPVMEADRNGKLLYANSASQELLQALDCNVGQTLPSQLKGLIEARLAAGENAETEVPCSNKVFSFSTTSVSEEGEVYLYGHDITDRKRAESELISMRNHAVEQSLRDALTGIGNRVLFDLRVPEMILQNKGTQKKMAMVLVDIDNFKDINDSYGHKVGDQVIIHVACTLRENLKSTDLVCRWGGDELVLFISDLPDRPCMAAICTRLIDAVKRGAVESDLPASVSMSIGYAFYPEDGETAGALMQKADAALYRAKADGRDCFREYCRKTAAKNETDDTNLFHRLTGALQEHRLTPFFQPLIDTQTGLVAGVEALARWKDPDYGFIPPDTFIPLAEAKGLIVPLSKQIMSGSLASLRHFLDRGHNITVSINLSKRQLLDAEFLIELREEVQNSGLRPEQIIFEVTERQSILGHAVGRQRLEEMARAGFRLSLDDFGSGYSSFDLVGELPFKELKIYSGLIRKMQTEKGRRIVQAIVEMGTTLNLSVVAEGVEEQWQVDLLKNMGVKKIQGYFYSKPLCPEDLLSYLEKQGAPRITDTSPVQASDPSDPLQRDSKPDSVSF